MTPARYGTDTAKAAAIARALRDDTRSLRSIAKEFGTSHAQVSRIRDDPDLPEDTGPERYLWNRLVEKYALYAVLNEELREEVADLRKQLARANMKGAG